MIEPTKQNLFEAMRTIHLRHSLMREMMRQHVWVGLLMKLKMPLKMAEIVAFLILFMSLAELFKDGWAWYPTGAAVGMVVVLGTIYNIQTVLKHLNVHHEKSTELTDEIDRRAKEELGATHEQRSEAKAPSTPTHFH